MDDTLFLSDSQFRTLIEHDFTSSDSTKIINALLSAVLNGGDYDLAVSSTRRFFFIKINM